MKDFLAHVVNAAAPATVMLAMFCHGLRLVPSQQLAFIRERPLLMLRSLVAVLVLVPIAAVVVVTQLHPSRGVGVGLALLAASPVAPLQIIRTPRKGGSIVYLSALHLSLALLAIVTVPLSLYALSGVLDFRAEVGVYDVARTVVTTIILPVGLGIVVRAYAPIAAEATAARLGAVADLMVLVLIAIVLMATSSLLLNMDGWSYGVMGIFSVVNLGIGYALGPSDVRERTTLAMECGARNFGMALTIGTMSFSREQALPVLVPYIVVFTVISTIFLKWNGRPARLALGAGA